MADCLSEFVRPTFAECSPIVDVQISSQDFAPPSPPVDLGNFPQLLLFVFVKKHFLRFSQNHPKFRTKI